MMKLKIRITILFLTSLILILGISEFFQLSSYPKVSAEEILRILSEYPSWVYPVKEDFSSFQKGTELGCAVSAAGNIYGDFSEDVIVGAQKYTINTDREGAVFVFSGSFGGLSKFPVWMIGGGQKGSLFGCTVSKLGDVNGDSFDDFAVGACDYTNKVDAITYSEAGSVFVYYGPLTSTKVNEDWIFKGDQAGAKLGSALNSAGDVNNDGYPDLVFGAKNYSDGTTSNGKIFVFFGSPNEGFGDTPDWTAIGEFKGAQFGASVAGVGDINGDNYDDIIVGSPYAQNNLEEKVGCAYIFLGTEGGLQPGEPSKICGEKNTALYYLPQFGTSVVGIKDINGDTYDDVLISAIEAENEQEVVSGCVYLFLGSEKGLVAEPAWSTCGDQESGQFGQSVSFAEDMDMDGNPDFFVGMPKFSNINEGSGAVFLYFGSKTQFVRSDFELITGSKAGTMFGTSISNAVDVNNDGKQDVIVGAPTFKIETDNPIGRVEAYYAGEAGIPDLDNFAIFLPLVQR